MTATLEPASSPPPLVPPDESTWRRYSAHKEGEMSWATSAAIHILVVGVLIALGVLITEQRKTTDDSALKDLLGIQRRAMARAVVMAPNPNPVGTGNPGGPGGVAPLGDTSRPEGAAPDATDKLVDRPLNKLDPVDVQKLAQTMPEWLKDSEPGRRLIQTGVADDQLMIIRNLNAQVVEDLHRSLQRPVGEAGKTGTAEGDANGKPGEGGDRNGGASAAAMNERQKRMFRWKLTFPPINAPEPQRTEHYLRQLDGLGALVGLPGVRGDTRFLVIRNLLKRPATPKVEDPARLSLLHWYETSPVMAQNVAQVLGVPIPNGYFILMPQSLEATMEKLEREKTPPGVRTDDIEETRFRVIEIGGKYTVECVDLRTK